MQIAGKHIYQYEKYLMRILRLRFHLSDDDVKKERLGNHKANSKINIICSL